MVLLFFPHNVTRRVSSKVRLVNNCDAKTKSINKMFVFFKIPILEMPRLVPSESVAWHLTSSDLEKDSSPLGACFPFCTARRLD